MYTCACVCGVCGRVRVRGRLRESEHELWQLGGWADGRLIGWLGGWVRGLVDGWVGGWVDVWIVGWVDGDGGLVVVADERGWLTTRPPAQQGIQGPGTDIVR